MKTYEISLLNGHTDTEPIIVNFEQLKQIITENRYALATFWEGKRSTANCRGAEFLGIDFDDGSLSIDEAAKMFKHYKHIIAPTKSHRIEKNGLTCDRFRIILFLDNYVSCSFEFKYIYKNLIKKYNLKADLACIEIARYFNPSKYITSENQSGNLLSVTELSLGFNKNAGREIKINKISLRFRPAHSLKGVLSNRTREFLKSSGVLSKSTNWHSEFLWAASDMYGQCYSYNEAYEALKSITGKLDNTHDLAQLEWVFEQSTLVVAYRYPSKSYNID